MQSISPNLYFRYASGMLMDPSHGIKNSRSKLLDTIRQFEPGTLIAIEACVTSHFWGRTFASMGYCAKLIPAQHVKAFVCSQKNDAYDTLEICETAFRPGIHFVSIKTTVQHDSKALRTTRQLMVEQKKALANSDFTPSDLLRDIISML